MTGREDSMEKDIQNHNNDEIEIDLVELFAELNGCGTDESVTAELAAAAVKKERLADRYFINKADDDEGMEKAANLAGLLGKPSVFGSLHRGEYKCL